MTGKKRGIAYLSVVFLVGVLAVPGYALVIGNPDAPQGGWMVQELTSDPINLNPITSSDNYTTIVIAFIYETLLEQDVETLDYRGLIADRWEISDDGMEFTFHIDQRAHFSDGTPITAEDVKYSFDVLFQDGINNVIQRAYYKNIEQCDIIDPETIRFTANKLYFKNFTMVALLPILPKHYFTAHNIDSSREINQQPIGSGPYVLSEWIKGNRIILQRDRKYWGDALEHNTGRYNVDRVVYKIVRDTKVSFEMFKKGEIDFYAFSARQWVKESEGKLFRTTLRKLDVQNRQPLGYSYIGWNNTSYFFKDKLVRQAMTHLVDREMLTKKFSYGFTEVPRGPFGNHSECSSPRVKALPFDISKAIDLLREAGWDDHDHDTVLDRDGIDFEFTLIAPGQDSMPQLSLVQEDMRKAGILMHLKVVEWNSFLKLLDDQKFDAVTLSWTGSSDPDPAGIWHSRNAVIGGNNFVQFRNHEVDRLCDQLAATMTRQDRIPLLHRIHEIIHQQQPYTFLSESTHSLLGYHSKYEFLQPYYNYGVGYSYWWIPTAKRQYRETAGESRGEERQP